MERVEGGYSPDDESVDVADFVDTEAPKFETADRHPEEESIIEDAVSDIDSKLCIGFDGRPNRAYSQAMAEQLLFTVAQRELRKGPAADSIDSPDLSSGDRVGAIKMAHHVLATPAGEFAHTEQPHMDKLVNEKFAPKDRGLYDVMLGRALLGDTNAERRLILFMLRQDDFDRKFAAWDELPEEDHPMWGKTKAPMPAIRHFTGEETLGGTGYDTVPVPENLKSLLIEHLNELNLANLAQATDRETIEAGANTRVFTHEKAGQKLLNILTKEHGFTTIDGVIVPADMPQEDAERYAAAFETYRQHFAETNSDTRQKNEEYRLQEIARLEGMIDAYNNAPKIRAEAASIDTKLQGARNEVQRYEDMLKRARVEERSALIDLNNAGFFGRGKARKQHENAMGETESVEAFLEDAKKKAEQLEAEAKQIGQKSLEASRIENSLRNGTYHKEQELESHRKVRWLPEESKS